MGFDRVSGTDLPGFPNGCSALRPSTLSRCEAEHWGHSCRLCRRMNGFPLPVEWDGNAGWNVIGTQTVQAIHLAKDPRAWVVVVMADGRWVSGHMPPIYCTSKDRALGMAFARAKQLEPRCRIKPWGRDPESWECGPVKIMVADPWG